jgi:putative transposase
MPRIARTVIPGAPHHVTQRGNRRQDVFFDDEAM